MSFQDAQLRGRRIASIVQRMIVGGWQATDAIALVYARVAVGIAIFIWADGFLDEQKYDAVFIQPRIHFKYAGFDWVRIWPGSGIYWHFIITQIAAVGLIVGLLTRVCAAILCGSIAYVLLVDSHIYVNHYYLLSCAAGLLAFLPCARQLSIDSLLGVERWTTKCYRWQLWLLRFQLGIPYFFGAVAKLNGDWLRGQPAELILRTRATFEAGGSAADIPGAIAVMTWGGFLYDLLIVPMLLWRPTRWIGVLLSITFHVTNGLILDIGVFPWFMLATIIVFFPPQWIRNRLRIFLGGPPMRPGTAADRSTRASLPRGVLTTIGFYLAVGYALIQLLLPIRPAIYPGDSNWNERGQRYAWRMMLRDKRSLTHYLLVDETTGERLFVPSTTVLTLYQTSHADHHPELIRQTAVALRELAENEFGVERCRVHALALVSLNGRLPRPLVDPTVDLSRVGRFGWRNDWIVEDPGPLRSPPYQRSKDKWWRDIKLPPPFEPLQGRIPEDLQRSLRERAERALLSRGQRRLQRA